MRITRLLYGTMCRRVVYLTIMLFLCIGFFPTVPAYGQAADLICGDANGDDRVNINDVLFIINFIFRGGPPPEHFEVADVNCDAVIDVSDAVYLINSIFRDGPLPCHDCPLGR